MRLTNEMILKGLTDNCVTKEQMSVFGLKLFKGWKKALLKIDCTTQQYNRFLQLKKPPKKDAKLLANNLRQQLCKKDRELQERYDALKIAGQIPGKEYLLTTSEKEKAITAAKKKKEAAKKAVTPFCTNEGLQVEESYTEQRIRKVLNQNEVAYFQECSFKELRYVSGNYPRFDFYLPDLSMVIEYDGEHHEDQEVKLRDNFKDLFCKQRGITVVRFNKIHFANLERSVLRAISKRSAFKNKRIKAVYR